MSASATWAILPVKALALAKQRLAPVLPAAARRELVLCMFERVLAAAVAVDRLARILVVTPDPTVADLAEARGALVLREARADGLNAAVCRGLTCAVENGAARALVLPADVPLLSVRELNALLGAGAAGSAARASFVPAADGDGTNAMLLEPPSALAPAFGPGSYVRHLAQALARRLDVEVLHLPGLAADIDRPADLARLLGPAPELRPFQFLGAHVMKAGGDARAGRECP